MTYNPEHLKAAAKQLDGLVLEKGISRTVMKESWFLVTGENYAKGKWNRIGSDADLCFALMATMPSAWELVYGGGNYAVTVWPLDFVEAKRCKGPSPLSAVLAACYAMQGDASE